jgi:hypothetical protein
MINREAIKRYAKDRYVSIPLIVGALAALGALAIAIVKFYGMHDKIILHVTMSREVDLVGARKEVFMSIGGYMALFLFNSLISYALYLRERFLSYIVLYAGAWISLLGFFFAWSLARLN